MVSITHCVITSEQAQLVLVLRKFPGLQGTTVGIIALCVAQGRILPPLRVKDGTGSTFLCLRVLIIVQVVGPVFCRC